MRRGRRTDSVSGKNDDFEAAESQLEKWFKMELAHVFDAMIV